MSFLDDAISNLGQSLAQTAVTAANQETGYNVGGALNALFGTGQTTGGQNLGNLPAALGSTSLDFVGGLLRQLGMSTGQEVSESDLNFALSVVKDIKPNDQVEAMLAAQMAVIHMATMTSAKRLAQVKTLAEHDSAERALNKLARTYTTQMEALKRYRTGGEQKVTVQHVSVGEGGQAIVGNVTQATPKTEQAQSENSTPALTDARQPAMPIIEDRKGARVPLRHRQKNDGKSSA